MRRLSLLGGSNKDKDKDKAVAGSTRNVLGGGSEKDKAGAVSSKDMGAVKASDRSLVKGGGAGASPERGSRRGSATLGGMRRGSQEDGHPADTVKVTVVKAQGILAKDKGGTSDPYAEVRIGKQVQKTQVIPKTLSPEWNESFLMDVNTQGSVLEVVLYDHDKGMIMGSSEFLGCVEVQVASLSVGMVLSEWHTLKWDAKYQKKKENVTGRVFLTIEPLSSLTGKSEEEAEELKKAKKPVRDVKKAEALREKGVGTLEVSVISAERLLAADRGGTSDPFAELACGGKKVKTSTKKKTLNPKWDEPFIIEVPAKALALEVNVFDADLVGSAFLGTVCVNLDDLPEGKDVLQGYALQPRSWKEKAAITGSIRLLCNYLLKPASPMKMPVVDKTALEDRKTKLGIGAITVCVVGGLQLMGSDSNISTYVEARVGEAKGLTETLQGSCPGYNAAFLLDVAPGVQCLEITVFEKSTLGKDRTIGVVSVLLSDLKPTYESSWQPLVPLRASDKAAGAIKITTCAHGIPEILVERPRREFREIKENASKGLGTVELTVVAAKQLVASDETGTREPMAVVTVGQEKSTTELGERSLNPVFNKPFVFKIDPGVKLLTVELLDKLGKGGRDIGLVEIDLEKLEEGTEYDQWHPLLKRGDKNGEVQGELRLCVNYVSKISFTDPAALGISQQAIGDVEVVIITGRGLGSDTISNGGEDDDWTQLQEGDLVRACCQIGTLKKMGSQGREAPTPVWNESFALKLPHPTAVLEVHVFVEDVDGEIAKTPYGSALVPLGDLKDGEQAEQWHSVREAVEPGTPAEEGAILGSIQLLVTVRRNYGFNLELLGGLVSCPWRCGTHFEPEDAQTHFIVCPLAPDPTAQVSCVHLGIGCKFKGPRFGMKDHILVCPFESVKDTVWSFMKEMRAMRQTILMQEDEMLSLREKIREMELAAENQLLDAEHVNQRYKAQHEANAPPPDSAGAGLVEFEFTPGVVREKIIKWIPKGCTYTLEGHKDGVLCLGHDNLHNKLVSGSADRTVRVWDIMPHEPVCDGELKGHRGGVTSIAVGGKCLVTGSVDCTLKVWDVSSMREVAQYGGHKGLIHGIIVLGDMAISTSQDKCIKIWDLRLGVCVTTIETVARGCYGLAVHDIKMLQASGSKIFTWDLRKIASSTMNEEQRNNFGRYDTLTGNASGVYGHQMVGDRLYTSAVDNSVRLWDLHSMQVKSKIVGHTDFVRTLAVAGERLITGSDDKSIRIWDLEFHDCAKVLRGHGSYITAIKAARARLFSASMDKTIKVWE